MKGPLAVAQKTQAARAESEKRKSTGHVEDHTGPRELLVESEGSIDISNVQGNAGERKVHAFTFRKSCASDSFGSKYTVRACEPWIVGATSPYHL
jgi:hypothetical protein